MKSQRIIEFADSNMFGIFFHIFILLGDCKGTDIWEDLDYIQPINDISVIRSFRFMDTQCISCQYKKGMFVYNHQIISNFARDKRRCLNRMFIMVPMYLPDND